MSVSEPRDGIRAHRTFVGGDPRPAVCRLGERTVPTAALAPVSRPDG